MKKRKCAIVKNKMIYKNNILFQHKIFTFEINQKNSNTTTNKDFINLMEKMEQ